MIFLCILWLHILQKYIFYIFLLVLSHIELLLLIFIEKYIYKQQLCDKINVVYIGTFATTSNRMCIYKQHLYIVKVLNVIDMTIMHL
jgi:hypothetical protein